MMVRRFYDADEMRTFLTAVDRHLSHATDVVVIGGAAAALHETRSTTSDVDTWNELSASLERAIERARKETGLDIPVSRSPVADIPYEAEDRFERMLPALAKLRVFVLEKHDLALSKIVRGDDHDLQQLEELHAQNPLSFDTLVARFRTEMTHVMGDRARIEAQFLELVDRLFGELKRIAAEKALG